MPLLGDVIGTVGGVVGGVVGGLTGGTSGASGTSGTSGTSSSTSGTSGTSGATSMPATPPAPVPVGQSIAAWAMQSGETVYLNTLDPSTVGPTAWLPMTVRYVFADGNAVLTAEPNIVAYTKSFSVGANLRRKSETYNSDYPGP